MRADGSTRLRGLLRDPWVLGAAVVVLTIALLYGFLAHPIFNPDDYVRWADHFGRWWETADQQPVMRTPGYPLFLSLCFDLGLGNAPVIVLQSLALAATCVVTAGLTASVAGLRAGRLAAWVFAAYLPLLTYAGTAMTEVLATSLILLAVVATMRVRAQPARALRWGAVASLAGALATIIHPNVAMYFGVLAIALVWLSGSVRRAIRMAGVIVACTALIFGPWVVRNLAATGKPMPFGDNSTYPLALGVHLPWDKTSGRYGSHDRSDNFFGGLRPDGFTTAKARTTKPLHVLREDLFHHTGEFVESRVLMTYNMWSYPATPRIQSGTAEVVGYGFVRSVHLLMIVGGWIGLVLLRRTLFGRLGLALSGVTLVVHLVYWANPRYIIPIAPYLLAGTGVTLSAAWDVARGRAATWQRDARAGALARGSGAVGKPATTATAEHATGKPAPVEG
ncbi:MAG: Dolichyl-phosphate-mannose-protein mannosyltransferase [Conexibacter sp.]|nr:Dolichyl-phosphate-mannose-protein mannosyltransferase [Conexibacter sp.]